MRRTLAIVTCVAALTALGACSKHAKKAEGGDVGQGEAGAAAKTPGTVKIDGSSTVFPISEAVAEEFRKAHKARVTIGVSGTGGGMKKFCAGEIDVTGASRTMKPTEAELCKKGGVDYIELPVAYDGLSVVMNPKNDWVDHLTVDELKTIWAPEAQGKVTSWNQVREGFPDKKLVLFGPGVDSGTFDYFTKKIVGKAQSSRGDYTASEDDNVLVHGVAGDTGGLGFFGFAYYAENKSKLKIVPVKEGEGAAVTPTVATIADGTYKPLSRPIFVYVRKAALKRVEVKDFVKFYLDNSAKLAAEVGYVGLSDKDAKDANQRFTGGAAGSNG